MMMMMMMMMTMTRTAPNTVRAAAVWRRPAQRGRTLLAEALRGQSPFSTGSSSHSTKTVAHDASKVAHPSLSPSASPPSTSGKTREELERELKELDQQILALEEAMQGQDDEEDRWGEWKNPTTGEIGGPRGPEPTRYGDWSYSGRCTDF